MTTEALEPDAWQLHIDYMYETFGRRDPECFWCGERIVMALQGFYGGGIWTTDPDDEGPLGTGSPPGITCAPAPDGHHEVLNRGKGRR